MADHQVQFEAMRSGDCSWHPCQLTFSPNGGGLGIKYENNSSQDILMSEKEVLMRIRVRSLPLLEDDCTRIKPGDHVVCQNSEKGFFDAEIEKVLSVRHSKRAQCRCKFIVKWLHHDLDGKSLTVASSSVMRLADKSINDHPTILAFLESVSMSNSCFASMSPQLTVVNDFDLDLDLHDLLEKQIEGIRNSVHGSKKRIRDEILGLEANNHEQVKETDIAVSNASALEDNKSPLNPLAARAALASRMSKLSTEISPNISNGIDDFPNITKESLETDTAPKPAKTVKKSLFSTGDISTNAGQQRQVKMSPDLESRNTRAKIQRAKGIFIDTIERNNSVNGNNPSTVTNRRLTRSVPNKEGNNITTETTTVGANSSSNTRRRATRSSINQDAASINTDTTKESDGNELSPKERNKKINTEGTNGSSNIRRRATRSSINQESADIQTDTVIESDGDELPTEQKSKKRDTAGNATNNGGNSYGSKKKKPLDLNKHKLRSSPRFRS